MNFNHYQLEQKVSPEYEKILSISFEYLVAGVLKEYCAISKLNGPAEFNRFGRISQSVLLVYPFFISLSNGHSESLFKLFGDFYPLNTGPTSISIFTQLKYSGKSPREFRYFEFGSLANSFSIKVRKQFEHKSFDDIQILLRSEEIELNDQSLKFESVTIFNDRGQPNPIYLAIESGVKAIKDQSLNTFFDGNISSIRVQASHFVAFSKALKVYGEKAIPKPVRYDDIEPPERRPFYKQESSVNIN